MGSIVERSYGRACKAALSAFNPLKRRVVKTECRVHRFITYQSAIILKNDGFLKAGSFFSKHMDELNSGVVWADQDLKNRNHFYNPDKERGLYGFSNALKECIAYYTAALT
jgi:phospholipase C